MMNYESQFQMYSMWMQNFRFEWQFLIFVVVIFNCSDWTSTQIEMFQSLWIDTDCDQLFCSLCSQFICSPILNKWFQNDWEQTPITRESFEIGKYRILRFGKCKSSPIKDWPNNFVIIKFILKASFLRLVHTSFPDRKIAIQQYGYSIYHIVVYFYWATE